jgi:hypothetical protein
MDKYEQAARTQDWSCGGYYDDIIYNTAAYESWKGAASWSPQCGSVYDNWQKFCEEEGIDVEQ